MKQRTNVSKATTKAPAPKIVSVTKSGYNNSYAWSGYEQAQKRNTGTGTAATSSSRSSGTTRGGGSTRSSGTGGAASSAPAYTPPVSIASSVSGIASGVSEAAKRAEEAKRAAEAKRLEQARADYIKRRLAELKPQGVYSAPQQASAQKKGYNNNYAWSGYEQAQKGVKTSSGQATTTQSQQPTYNNTSTPKQTSHLGGVSKPDDPAGFVSQFGSDFKLGKNPFAIIKPDGTSDLTPKQQQEAAAIFSNVFDGESYYNYKLQEAVKNIASRFGAKSAKPSSAKPQSAWDEIEATRDEQLERRRSDRFDNEGNEPRAMRKADERDENSYVKPTPLGKEIVVRFDDEELTSTPKREEAAQQVIKNNREYILTAAEEFDVDPQIVAAAIYTEQALNYDIADILLDDLAYVGIDMSVGVGQVRVSTAKAIEEAGYLPQSYEKGINRTNQNIIEKLKDDETNIRYVAAYLKMIEDTWAQEYPEISKDGYVLSTLYNIGLNKQPHSEPATNSFGYYAGNHLDLMGKLLNQHGGVR